MLLSYQCLSLSLPHPHHPFSCSKKKAMKIFSVEDKRSVCLTHRFAKALAGVAQLVGHCSANQKVADLIPGQGICLGCGFGPLLGMCKRQLIHVSLSHQCFSPSLFLSLPLSEKILKSNNKIKL